MHRPTRGSPVARGRRRISRGPLWHAKPRALLRYICAADAAPPATSRQRSLHDPANHGADPCLPLFLHDAAGARKSLLSAKLPFVDSSGRAARLLPWTRLIAGEAEVLTLAFDPAAQRRGHCRQAVATGWLDVLGRGGQETAFL